MAKINKTAAIQFLSKTSPEKAFWCHDGKIFYDLNELNAGLRNINPHIFVYHANSQKNDFSRWIAEVIGDHTLSEELTKIKNEKAAARKVGERVAFLRKIAK